MTKKLLAATSIAGLALTVALTGCSTKAESSSGHTSGDVKAGPGITDDTITLGVQSDLSGTFKQLGLGVTNGNQMWANDVNDRGGICGRQIELDIQDNAYKPENAIALYETQKSKVAGMLQLIGSPVLAALKPRLVGDQMLTVPISWASSNLDAPEILMIGQTFDVETINGLAYAQQEGMLADGDKIGHIYIDSEFGQNALLGLKSYAKQHDLEVVAVPVSATDTDMTATVTKLKQDGVKLIFASTSPAALTSIAVQNTGQGLNVPIVGNSSTFAPNMLADPQVVAALDHYYHVNSVLPFSDKAPEAVALAKEYTAEFTDPPSMQVFMGYVSGLAFEAVLEQACDDGDLSHAGLVAAREKVQSVDTKGLSGELDFSVPGAPTSREAVVMKADPAVAGEGGLSVIQSFFASDEAKNYKAPHQK